MAIKSEKSRKKAPKQPSAEEVRAKQAANLLRVVEDMHREKNIPKDIIFNGIEAALQHAAMRSATEEEEVLVHIDRTSGEIIAQKGDRPIDPELLGRIAAQAAKQLMIQKIREAESEGVFSEFQARKGELVTGTIQRLDQGTAIVTLGKDGKSAGSTIEALLPRSEQIPGESHHVNERVKAVVMDVRRQGHRVKIVLSRCHPDFVKALFEQEIPEIADRTIEIKAVSREAGYRSKVAVSSIDSKVDCVGACVGVRGSRIKNVIDEINGERIDIVRWNDSMQIMIPNALQPAEISEVMLYPRLGRAIVLVTDDQLSLAIGRRGQNVRLASKLVGWDIEIMTHEELGEGIERAERWFSKIPGSPPEFAETLITEGFLSYTDLTFLAAEQLVDLLAASGIEISEEDADNLILYAEDMVEQGIEEEEEEAAAAAAAQNTESLTTQEEITGASTEEQGEAQETQSVAEEEVVGEPTEALIETSDELAHQGADAFDNLFQTTEETSELPEGAVEDTTAQEDFETSIEVENTEPIDQEMPPLEESKSEN
jgi:transcription termination/antitermination protein NusA